jgi:hypothetical protein
MISFKQKLVPVNQCPFIIQYCAEYFPVASYYSSNICLEDDKYIYFTKVNSVYFRLCCEIIYDKLLIECSNDIPIPFYDKRIIQDFTTETVPLLLKLKTFAHYINLCKSMFSVASRYIESKKELESFIGILDIEIDSHQIYDKIKDIINKMILNDIDKKQDDVNFVKQLLSKKG